MDSGFYSCGNSCWKEPSQLWVLEVTVHAVGIVLEYSLDGGSRNSNNSSRSTIVVSSFATTVRREPRCNHRDHAVPIQNHKYDVVLP